MTTHESTLNLPVPQETDVSTQPETMNLVRLQLLIRLTVLPHENPDEFSFLFTSLMNEHQPVGATEEHLVEDLICLIWRKRRILQSEIATINKGLRYIVQGSSDIIGSAVPLEMRSSRHSHDIRELLAMSPEELNQKYLLAKEDLQATRNAIAILQESGPPAYDEAVKALYPDSREWWEECVADEEYPATAEGLGKFLSVDLEPLCQTIESELRHHAAIKAQTIGAGLEAHRLTKLNHYETHLDRKMERTLGMLLKLKEIRSEE